MKWTGIVAGMCLAMVSLSTCQGQGCGDVMCAMYCEYGFKVANDCPTCECNAQTEIKDGQCPIVDADIVGTCDESCAHDGVCPGEQKCCSNGCGHVCMDPVRPGYCSVSDFSICGGSSCTMDSGCSQNNTFKCCKNSCGQFTCIPPAEEKRGTCPTGSLPEGSLGLCADICSQDQDCPALQKCCSNGCGHVCITPADLPEIHSGSCPAVPEGRLDFCAGLCENDGTCGATEKCCRNACGGYGCVEAVNETPVCDAFMCLRWCPFGFKRDENGCKMCDCQEPTLIRAGECPVAEGGTVGICVDSCAHDGECAENQKCCSNGCGHACVAMSTAPADPEGCPINALEGMVGICSEDCGTGCPSGQLCCSNGCGHACKDSVTVHMGECPIGNLTTGSIGACVEMCSYDGECAANQKCCSNGCGHVCITVNNEQPGNCPDVTCLIFCEYGNKKDSKGCKMCECQGPVEAKVERAGECPIGLLPEGIVGICVEECSSDFECRNTTQKCCSNGCGHVCTDALNVGPQCPPVCQRYCENGNVKDTNGCDTCKCNEEKKCDSVICTRHCPYGNKKDTDGCNVCECKDKPPGCPDTICALFCPFGLQRDAEGCEVCTCTSSALASFSTAGECPAPSGNTAAGSCADLCDNDSECNDGEKCCYNGCGHTCVGLNGNGANVLSSPFMLLLLTLLSVVVTSKL